MRARRHRMRKQQRRDSAKGWIRSGVTITVKCYAKRYGVDRYAAYDDLAVLGVALPASAGRWARRPSSVWRPVVVRDAGPVDNLWIMLDGRRFFVAGFTAGGVPYGIYEDELESCDDSSF